ncbi:unnamed protein product [Tuber melanosporum]|uniref:(Perigord truffle) hypothetical protein n=1 Tax=Tuber melanosporum (strain Mel28) TaxID=656061 RepID=D5GKG5_TUBMM|nr:uncharacterized protein GSTUM_00009537001 [Tuber melanosporum]CAZ85008.1 unnamed protein product [Tuber melanosporum]
MHIRRLIDLARYPRRPPPPPLRIKKWRPVSSANGEFPFTSLTPHHSEHTNHHPRYPDHLPFSQEERVIFE